MLKLDENESIWAIERLQLHVAQAGPTSGPFQETLWDFGFSLTPMVLAAPLPQSRSRNLQFSENHLALGLTPIWGTIGSLLARRELLCTAGHVTILSSPGSTRGKSQGLNQTSVGGLAYTLTEIYAHVYSLVDECSFD